MKVFLAWSGRGGRALADAFHAWLPSVLQSVQTLLSAEDIDKGARWVSEIAKELDDSGFGVLCVTRENVSSEWLNFEAGALSKAFAIGRAAPVLVDLKPTDVTGPLATFQMATLTKQDIHGLVRSINGACSEPLDEPRVSAAFEQWWPVLQQQLDGVRKVAPDGPPAKRDTGEMVEEMLGIMRSVQRDVSNLVQIEDEERDAEPIVVWKPTKAQLASARFSEGTRARHPRYGDGTILKSTMTRAGEEVVVKFDEAGTGVKIFAVAESELAPIYTVVAPPAPQSGTVVQK